MCLKVGELAGYGGGDCATPAKYSGDSKPPIRQAIGDLPGQGGGVSVVIANRLDRPLFEVRVKILQHCIVGNRALLSRGCSFYANLQARAQQDKIERHFLEDLAGRVDVRRWYGKSMRTRKPERANGIAAAVIDRTSTGKLSCNPQSAPFVMNDHCDERPECVALDVAERGGK